VATLCYARVSRQEQSLETQLFLFQQQGFDELFVEKISGRREDRPEFQRLCDRALALRGEGQDVEILFVEFSRWGRNTSYALQMVERLEGAGVKLRELHGGEISVATSTGLMNTGLKALMAHGYSVQLSERVTRAYDRRRAQRRPLCGNAPFGYRYNKEHTQLEPHPEQWPIAREIVDRMIAGESKYSIRKWLIEEHGIRRSGSGLNKLVLSEAWRGNIVDKKNAKVFHGTHQPLLTDTEYRTLKERVELNRRLRGANQGKVYPIPSGGLVRCARCGYAEVTSTTRGRRYFRCTQMDCTSRQKYIRSEAIEAAIQEAILERAESVAQTTIAADQDAPEHPKIIELEAELKQLEAVAHRPAIALEIEEIEKEIMRLRLQSDVDASDFAERQAMIQTLSTLESDDWARLTPLERRDIYSYLVESVIVDGHEIIEVNLRFWSPAMPGGGITGR